MEELNAYRSTFLSFFLCLVTAFLVASTFTLLHTLLSMVLCGVTGIHLFLRNMACEK